MFFIGQNLKRLRVIYSCNELLLFFWLTFLFEVWFDLDVDVEEPMSFLMQKKTFALSTVFKFISFRNTFWILLKLSSIIITAQNAEILTNFPL